MQKHRAIPTLVVLAVLTTALQTGYLVAAESPDMRPALIGSGAKALINRIDGNALIKKGQQDAAVLILCPVLPDGSPGHYMVYGGTPGSDPLRQEVRNKLLQSKFIPAVYNHGNVRALFIGTVTFMNVNGRPRVRIFANQEIGDLGKEADFISPQPITIPGHFYKRGTFPQKSWQSDEAPGYADLSLTIDATGALKEAHVMKENPPGARYGEAAMQDIKEFTFLPAYRGGRPVESTTHFTKYFVVGGKMKM